MILSFTLWVQATDFFSYLRGSAYSYPIILSLHMVAIAMFGGMILLTDLRLLGWAFRKYPVSDLIDQLRVPKRYGFLLVAVCGILMFCCKAEEYYYNIFFRLKMTTLILIAIYEIAFRERVYGRAARFDRDGTVPPQAKLAAVLSLFLWVTMACMGRGIGYIEPPFGIHAGLWGFLGV